MNSKLQLMTAAGMLLSTAWMAGCTTSHELAMNPAKSPIVDDSATPAEIPKYKRIMVVAPPGRNRGDVEADLATIERELIRNGVTLIAAPAAADDSGRSAGDGDRLLASAKTASADAILEINVFGPARAMERGLGARFFAPEGAGVIKELGDDVQRLVLIKSGTKAVVETDEASYAKLSVEARKLARTFEDDVMELTGRLVEVKSREVVSSLHYYAPGVRCGRPYFETMDDTGKTTGSAYDWSADEARRLRRGVARKAIIAALADRVSGNGAR